MLLLLFSGMASAAQAPSTFMGECVKEVTYQVLDHQSVTLHEIPSGPIPEQTGHMRFPLAGPFVSRAADGQPPRYHWGYAVEFLDGSVPTRVLIEDVTGQAPLAMVDDGTPKLARASLPTWNGDATDCVIRRDNPCAAWMFANDRQRFILRVTATLADGTTDTLYQAIQFEPDSIHALLDAMGIAR
ncbi:MAG TPA: hypothetical protein VLM17_08305 [Xanthomonadaceae bacterium]|nr:hypothetical protein [Xanthomonadaceae bacterium]